MIFINPKFGCKKVSKNPKFGCKLLTDLIKIVEKIFKYDTTLYKYL